MPCTLIWPLVALSTSTVPLWPVKTANAPWLQGALSAPPASVQLSLTPPGATQVPEPPLTWPLFLGPASPSQ
ncbi:Uncharacterised protein [Achromobacter sp. 2789STDY5608615]|nr:Uncharacterised protein [Achromobacter sp. 2789STDY5608615]